MNFWQGYLIGRWTKRSNSGPSFFAGLFAMAFGLALVAVVCQWALVAVPIVVLCMVVTWCRTHNLGLVKMTLALLAVAALMILLAVLIIFVLWIFLSAVPVLLWIGILLTAGFCLPLPFKCFALVLQIWGGSCYNEKNYGRKEEH